MYAGIFVWLMMPIKVWSIMFISGIKSLEDMTDKMIEYLSFEWISGCARLKRWHDVITDDAITWLYLH